MLIIYGRGLIAEEYCRYLETRGRGEEVVAFAVTKLDGQRETYCGRPCLEIKDAVEKFPEAQIHLALQEKYHEEVMATLKAMGKVPAEIIGLRRITEFLGEQGIREIRAMCPGLAVRRSPYDYSVLEIAPKEHPEEKYTFYPMSQMPTSEQDLAHIRECVQGNFYGCWQNPESGAEAQGKWTEDILYIAMATSLRDAKVSSGDLPAYVHPMLGGATAYKGSRSRTTEYDDEGRNISRFNNLYSELTVAYRLWQKAPRAKYLGLCHYRRHFALTEEVKAALASEAVDVLLTRPRLTFPCVRKFFTDLPVTYTDLLDYETMLDFIGRMDKNMADFAETFLSGQIQFPNNMVIAKREIYLDYCRFMFAVLLGMQEYYQGRNVSRVDRFLGNVGEMLTSIYFAYHKAQWRTGFVDYRLLEQYGDQKEDCK